jgi:hypothetical protein
MKFILVSISFLAWVAISVIIFFVCQGPEPHFKLDDNYQLWRWPGQIAYVNPPEGHDLLVFEGDARVNAVVVLNDFIIGRIDDKWFAINRKTQEVFYPYSSKQALEFKTGVKFSELDLITSMPWSYMIVYSWTKKALAVNAAILVTILIGILYFVRAKRISYKNIPKVSEK